MPQVRDLILLKVGAQVMCTANIMSGVLVNGSRGVVVGFVDARRVASDCWIQLFCAPGQAST